ncbi:MAG: sugar phosphate isomerase/epimerase family protein [Saccharofermentanales bacterium]
MIEPKIYLSVDNCFASKRWTDPVEWMDIAASLGLNYVEASADTECDPLYHGEEYISRWADTVLKAASRTGIRISSLYSGHGSYTTLGLAHTDESVRRRFLEHWLMPMIRLSARLDAGMGFFCHAFPEKVMNSADAFRLKKDELIASLTELSAYAGACGCRFLTLEQMYTPHQIPWTIGQAAGILADTLKQSGAPLYITVDTGHMYAQKKFSRPTEEKVRNLVAAKMTDPGNDTYLWTGNTDMDGFIAEHRGSSSPAEIAGMIHSCMDSCPYMFADKRDADTYEWLRELGVYSPVVHLQQTTGTSSSHLAFTSDNNFRGIITPDRVISALQESCRRARTPGMPPICENIYLTFEIFSSTGDYSRDIIKRLEESVAYWREYIPEDGVPLHSLKFS